MLLPVEQLVNFSTRGERKLDLVFTDVAEYMKAGCKKEPPVSNNDHCAISLQSTPRDSSVKYQTKVKRLVTPEAKILLSKDLQNVDWGNLTNETSVDKKAEMLYSTIQALLDRHCSIRKVRVPTGKPLICSPLITKLRNAKKKAYRQGNLIWKFFSSLQKKEIQKELMVALS